MSHTDKEQTIADLIGTLNNGHSWKERSQAADTLIDIGESAVKPLKDSHSEVRGAAILALAQVADEQAI